jgi:hypothetical protein
VDGDSLHKIAELVTVATVARDRRSRSAFSGDSDGRHWCAGVALEPEKLLVLERRRDLSAARTARECCYGAKAAPRSRFAGKRPASRGAKRPEGSMGMPFPCARYTSDCRSIEGMNNHRRKFAGVCDAVARLLEERVLYRHPPS